MARSRRSSAADPATHIRTQTARSGLTQSGYESRSKSRSGSGSASESGSKSKSHSDLSPCLGWSPDWSRQRKSVIALATTGSELCKMPRNGHSSVASPVGQNTHTHTQSPLDRVRK